MSTYYYRATKVPKKGYGHKHHDKPSLPKVENPVKVGFTGTPKRGMMNDFFENSGGSVYVSSTAEGAHNFILENPNNIGFKWDIHRIKTPVGSYRHVIGIGGQARGEARDLAIERTTDSVKQQYRRHDEQEVRAAVQLAESKPLGKQAFDRAARSVGTSYVDDVARYNLEYVTSRVSPEHVKLHKSYDYRKEGDFYGVARGAEIRRSVSSWNQKKDGMEIQIYRAAAKPLLTQEQRRTQASGAPNRSTTNPKGRPPPGQYNPKPVMTAPPDS